ncbi:MAG: 5-(carboxyamino)imidazole ribonucleotide mutase [Nitrospirae bacterium YQR-1]
MGSDSDVPVVEKAAAALTALGVPFEVKLSSAHRMPDETALYAQSARQRGIEVIIAAAGMAAHLAGAIAANTTLPVIGIPVKSGELNGLDALYSTVQMPTGIPVATVAINGAANAAYLAASILSIKYPDIVDKLQNYRESNRKILLEKSKNLSEKFAGN